jgi:hypothetical protein
MKKIAFEINWIFRCFFDGFKNNYIKQYPEREVKEPIEPNDPLSSFIFYENELEDFLFDNAYFLFAKTILPNKNRIVDLNNLYNEFYDKKIKLVLFSKENIKFRGLTAFFIANFSTSFYFDELIFINTYKELYDYNFTNIVTYNKQLIELYPNETILVDDNTNIYSLLIEKLNENEKN